jgi:hypothetical protein
MWWSQSGGTITTNGIAPASYTTWTDTGITFVAGTPTTAGLGNVVETNGDGNSVTLTNAWTYTSASATPSITSVTYTGAARPSSTYVIHGAGFLATQGGGSVAFGVVAATVSAWTDTTITGTIPAGSGTVAVSVNTSDALFASLAGAFTYTNSVWDRIRHWAHGLGVGIEL